MYKSVASILSAVLVTGLVAWFSFGGGVSKAEGEELKRTDSAILQRQAVLEEKLNSQASKLDELKVDSKESNKTIQDKLDAIIRNLPRDK